VHELSVATAVLGTALKHADGRPVSEVGVRVGALRQVVPESLRFYFEIVARDSPCEGASLILTEVDARLRCSACGQEWTPVWAEFRCSGCGAAEVDVVSGDELLVDYIEVEESQAKEPECIAPR
jgi:hydrogenase nickel incorporation protein HypA/HybF